jgi:hypothetical protein
MSLGRLQNLRSYSAQIAFMDQLVKVAVAEPILNPFDILTPGHRAGYCRSRISEVCNDALTVPGGSHRLVVRAWKHDVYDSVLGQLIGACVGVGLLIGNIWIYRVCLLIGNT